MQESLTHQLRGEKKDAQSGLLVVDLPVAIDVRLADHLVDLLVRELLAEVRHHVAQLGGADEAVAIAVEHLVRNVHTYGDLYAGLRRFWYMHLIKYCDADNF